jgi:hypothetical protein
MARGLTRWSRCIAQAAVALALWPLGAAAAPQVTAAYPIAPLQIGASSAELGFEVDGSTAKVIVGVSGESASSGSFCRLSGVLLSRDQAGAVAFHALVAFSKPFPSDGVLRVTAEPADAGGAKGAVLAATFDASAPTPSFGSPALRVRADPGAAGTVVVEVAYSGPAAGAELSLLGVSAEALRKAHGSLSEAEGAAFVRAKRMAARPRPDSPGRIAFSIPTSAAIPVDGVVIADASLRDPFGRTLHTSAVEFTSGTAFDQVLGLSAKPAPMLLAQGFGQVEALRVLARYAVAGEVDLSGPSQGVTYRSLNEGVAVVAQDGRVVARANGEANLEVSYAGYTELVHVIVDSAAQLQAVSLLPAGASIPRVGKSIDLRFEGVLSDGRRVDLTPGAFGTSYFSSDPTILTVSADGKVTSRRPGFATITADNAGHSASLVVEAIDGPPEIRLIAPSTASAGSSFALAAIATDDVGVQYVDFLVDNVRVSRVSAAPYSLQIAAPPFAGGSMSLSAVAVDTNGTQTPSAVVNVAVTGAPAPSTKRIVYNTPQPGATWVEGLPHAIRVTSNTGLSIDFQTVRFYVDDRPIGESQSPRVEGSQALWEISYVPPRGSGGTTAVIRAEAVDKRGAPVRGDALLVPIAQDTPPMVVIQNPAGSKGDATVGVPVTIKGVVGDDTLTLGVDVALLVEGTAVATSRLGGSALPGFEAGTASFAFPWVAPPSMLNQTLRFQVQAVDAAGNEQRASVDITVRKDMPPQVAILTPTAGTLLLGGSKLALTASVMDDGKDPTPVSWFIDGVPVGFSSTAPYAVQYEVPKTSEGHSLVVEAVARDSAGNQTRAQPVTVAVTPDTAPPSVSIVLPRSGATAVDTQDLLVTAAGVDDVGVARVELLFDGQVFYTDNQPGSNEGIPGSFITHDVVKKAQLAAGDHHIAARAYDFSGNVGFSPDVLV